MKKLMLMLALCASLFSTAQVQVHVGASKTELRDNAILIGISYLKSLDSIFGEQERFIPGKNSFFMVTPQADIITGTSDSYSSINIKLSGVFATFKTTDVEGLITPDFDRTAHTFPMSLGVETSNLFNNVNAIYEIGWVPFYQSYGRNSPALVKNTRFGVFLQTGYKILVDSTGNTAIGGEVDKSLEEPNEFILRTHGTFSLDTKSIIKLNGLDIGLVGGADVWYDIANGALYHKLQGIARFYLDDTKYIDFIYSKGSGAPLFNYADQFSAGFTFKF
jgi:hypothetical protein